MLLINKGVSPLVRILRSYMAPQNVSLASHFNNNYNYVDNSPKTYFVEKAFIKLGLLVGESRSLNITPPKVRRAC